LGARKNTWKYIIMKNFIKRVKLSEEKKIPTYDKTKIKSKNIRVRMFNHKRYFQLNIS